MIDRIKVILTAAVTWLVVLATVLTIVAGELQDQGGDFAPVVAWIARIITVIGVVVTIIRRVTPVLPQQRGLLPVAGTRVDLSPHGMLVSGVPLSPTDIESLKAQFMAQMNKPPQDQLGRPARWEPRRE